MESTLKCEEWNTRITDRVQTVNPT